MSTQIRYKQASPFLRWTGSKKWFIKNELDIVLPSRFNNYHECFLGSGAVFFSIDPSKRSYLNDVNSNLIETYMEVRDHLDRVIKTLKTFKNSEEDYYRIRSKKFLRPHTRAAQFIYLNRCSFNGIYRVNSNGGYNVPYGKRINVDIVTEDNLKLVSQRLQNTVIDCSDFNERLDRVNENDLVFIDPPYTVAHENNGFIEYNQKLFSWDDQLRLKQFIEEVVARGAYFILTNASHDSILDLYQNLGKITKVSRHCQVGGRNKTRGNFNELVICNTVN